MGEVSIGHVAAPVGIADRALGVVDLSERHRWCELVGISVTPQTGRRLEGVAGEEGGSFCCDEANGIDDVVEGLVVDEVVEIDPDPAGLDALTAAGDLSFEGMRTVEVDPEEPVAVGSGARTTAPGLDAEEIVQDGNHEIVVEIPVAERDDERDDRQPFGIVAAEDLDVGRGVPRLDGSGDELFLSSPDLVDPDRGLELEHQAGADRLDDGRGAALLPVGDVDQVVVLFGVDVGDRAATGNHGDPVGEQ